MKTYGELGIKHQIAVDLKLEGFKYKQIAKQLQVREQTVAEWFQTKGLCYEAFQQKKQEWEKERKVLFKEINEHLQDLACEAIMAIKVNLARNNVQAALGVLDRIGFRPIQKIQPVSEPRAAIIKYIYPENGMAKKDTSLRPYRPPEDA